MYECEIKLLKNLVVMFTKKGKESSCTTVKSNCAYAISEIKEVIKEYERINEKGTI